MISDSSTMSLEGSALAGPPPPPAVLRTIYPRALVAVHPVAVAPITIGRQPGPDRIELPHVTVSRQHVQLWWDPSGHHAVRDLGSRHGTLIGPAALGSAARVLADGEVLRLGDVLMVYERGARDDGGPVDAGAVPGAAPVMVALRAQLARAAADPAPVLVLGETGTGKEWIARELHRLSGRRGPLIAVNCATLTAQLAESLLFGHVKGAFTGAAADRDGWFRQADGGTLFLDEIGELPLELQAKLLRVVQDGVVQPLGASRTLAVDVRLCAATHRDLADDIEHGRFRRDLGARLAKVELRVPALRERRGDLLDWVDRLWQMWQRERGKAASELALRPAAAAALVNHAWPDNLRGLDRLLHDLALRGLTARPIEVGDLPPWVGAPAADPTPVAAATSGPIAIPAAVRTPVPSRDEFLKVWGELGGSVRAVARHFGRDRRQIYRWLESHGVRVDPADE